MTQGGCGRAYRPSQITGAVLLLQGLITPPNWRRSWTASVHISRQPGKIQSLHLSLYQQEPSPPCTHLTGAWGEKAAKVSEPEKSHWPRRSPWEGTRGMCWPTDTGLHQYLQSVPVTSHHTTLLEVSYHHTNPQNIFTEEPQWLPPSGAYTRNHEMLVLCHITTGAVVA